MGPGGQTSCAVAAGRTSAGAGRWRQGHGREAEHWLRQALELAPENAEYLTDLGVVLEALDDLDEAIERHRTAKLADAVRTPQQIQEHLPQAGLPLLSVPGLLGVASGDP